MSALLFLSDSLVANPESITKSFASRICLPQGLHIPISCLLEFSHYCAEARQGWGRNTPSFLLRVLRCALLSRRLSPERWQTAGCKSETEIVNCCRQMNRHVAEGTVSQCFLERGGTRFRVTVNSSLPLNPIPLTSHPFLWEGTNVPGQIFFSFLETVIYHLMQSGYKRMPGQ